MPWWTIWPDLTRRQQRRRAVPGHQGRRRRRLRAISAAATPTLRCRTTRASNAHRDPLRLGHLRMAARGRLKQGYHVGILANSDVLTRDATPAIPALRCSSSTAAELPDRRYARPPIAGRVPAPAPPLRHHRLSRLPGRGGLTSARAARRYADDPKLAPMPPVTQVRSGDMGAIPRLRHRHSSVRIDPPPRRRRSVEVRNRMDVVQTPAPFAS